jgi:ankyrin repeat protein
MQIQASYSIECTNKLVNSFHNKLDTIYDLHRGYGSAEWDEIKELIENGADVSAKSSIKMENFSSKWTLLHVAALSLGVRECDNLEILKFLLKHGSNVNAKDGLGNPPLHWAAEDLGGPFSMEIMEFLLEQGANPDL